VGRQQELAELRAALDKTSSRGHLFLISGEPGIGKTRLAEELAADARRRGIRVAWGRCWEGGGTPAYWPFIQIVRACLESTEPDRRRSILKSEITPHIIGEVAQIVPELCTAHGDKSRGPKSVDPETARFRLFDAVTNLLKTLATPSPMLIVFDDLHDADLSSLSMLGFVAREVHDAKVLIVGTYRDVELRRSRERLKLVEQILHEGHLLPLAGLGESEVGHMVESRAGRQPSEALVAKIHWLTGGNPLFTDGVVRVLAADGKLAQLDRGDLAELKLPDNVRAAIAGRLAMLSEEARDVLAKAAVIGQEFELTLLTRINELSADTLAESVHEASEVGILLPAARDSLRFTHPLIREALIKGQKDSGRIATHHAIGVALEQLHATDLTPHLAELAHHFREAGVLEQATEYSIRAGDAAKALFAYEEAADQFQAALDLMEKAGVDSERRARLFERSANVTYSFDEARHFANLEQALKLYETMHRTDRLLAIHTGLAAERFNSRSLMDIAKGFEHVQKAEAALVEAPSERARAKLDLAITLAAGRTLHISEGLVASSRGKEIADRLDDRRLSAQLGSLRAWLLCYAGRWAEGFALLDEAWRTADALNDQVPLGQANNVLIGMTGWLQDPRIQVTLAERELAKPRTAHATSQRATYDGNLHVALASMGRLAEAKLYRWEGTDPMVALYEGRWEDAERQWAAYMDWIVNSGGRFESNGHFLHLAWARRLQRKHSLAEAQLLNSITLCRGEALFGLEMLVRPELALLYADMNRPTEAEPHVERCREIMAAGEDWRGLAGYAVRAEAVVTAAEGNVDSAEQQFARALEIFDRYTLPFEAAETFLYWGRSLKALSDSRASEKFDAAIELYRRHGAGQRWIDRVESEMRTAPASRGEAGPQRAVVGASAEGQAIFKREGEFWTLAYGGTTFRLKNIKGLAYIAFLLANPGERFHVRELIARVEGPGATGSAITAEVSREVSTTHDLGDAGAALDPLARADYRSRLRELAEDLAEAERLNDRGRAESIRREQDFLTGELSAAVGIGGRRRKAAAHVERVRDVVTKNIRGGLRKIREEDATLGRHFAASIKTGYYCAYLPDPERRISWQL
jgi:tetratricopeptide (TPR) repeat protein